MSSKVLKTFPSSHYDHVIEVLLQSYQLAKDKGTAPEVLESLERVLALAQHKDSFMDRFTSKNSEGCDRLLKEAYEHDWKKVHAEGKTSWSMKAGMISGTLEGQYLKSFISMHKAKKALEIGMFTGFGALSMAEGMPADGQVVTIEIEPYLKELVQPLLDQSPHGNKVKIALGDARQVMKDLANAGEKFDVIFMDAAKDQYEEYMKISFEDNLLAPDGTVVVDNAFQHGKVFDPDQGNTVAKSFAAFVESKPDIHKVVLPLRDGLYILRRMSAVEGQIKK